MELAISDYVALSAGLVRSGEACCGLFGVEGKSSHSLRNSSDTGNIVAAGSLAILVFPTFRNRLKEVFNTIYEGSLHLNIKP